MFAKRSQYHYAQLLEELMPKKVAVLILAAGSSSRMGAIKQLLPVGKSTLLGVVSENALQSKADKVFCVLGANATEIRVSLGGYDVETIENSKHKKGLSSSIVAGINHIKDKNFDAVLIILGDQPLIDSIYLDELLSSFEAHSGRIIASNYNNGLGVPVIIPKTYYSELLQLKGDKGAKEFLTSQSKNVISLKTGALFDVDSQEDYNELIKKLNQN